MTSVQPSTHHHESLLQKGLSSVNKLLNDIKTTFYYPNGDLRLFYVDHLKKETIDKTLSTWKMAGRAIEGLGYGGVVLSAFAWSLPFGPLIAVAGVITSIAIIVIGTDVTKFFNHIQKLIFNENLPRNGSNFKDEIINDALHSTKLGNLGIDLLMFIG